MRYNYNNEVIKKLNITQFIKNYNLNNENYNLAIFCALSAVYEHYKKDVKDISTTSLLLGDYYSFEYYSLLQKDLDKLELLTNVMKNGYLDLINNTTSNNTTSLNEFVINIIKVWFRFYNLTIEDKELAGLTSL